MKQIFEKVNERNFPQIVVDLCLRVLQFLLELHKTSGFRSAGKFYSYCSCLKL